MIKYSIVQFYKQSIKILHMYIIKPYNEKRKR